MKKLLLFAAIFIAASLSAQNNQSNSLGNALNPDGTLNMNAANGSYDVTGFQITSAPGETPRFAPSAKGSKAAGDEFWTDPFTPSVGVDNEVLAICYMGGTAYIGGKFINASGMPVNYIASWNGVSWKHLVNGLSDQVNCIAASATKIYVGGRFTNGAGIANADYIIEYNPATSTWAAMGTGMNSYVNSLCVNGINVYAGGSFTFAGGVTNTAYVARWSTASWTWNSVISGLNGPVSVVAYSGSYLYISGSFTNANGIADADYIARYNGTTWSALNTTLFTSAVSCIIPDGSGNVYIGGLFANLGGNANADGVVKYTSATTLYSAVGTGVNGDVKDMSFDGTTLYIAGNFTSAGGAANTNKIAQCIVSTGTWSSIGNGLVAGNNANAIKAYSGDVIVGGLFATIDGKVVNNVAHYNTGTWLSMGSAFDGPVYCEYMNGNDIYFGGGFTHAGGYNANYFVKWNKVSGSWTTYDSLNSSVTTIVMDSSGNLFISGGFTDAGGNINADRIARWDGSASNWVALGTGISNNAVFDMVTKGNTLYATGNFADAGGNANCDYIAKWTGSSWVSLGSTPPLNVYTTKMYQYAGKVYVGGFFTGAGGIPGADYFAAWNTSTNSWESVGGGADNGVRDIFVDSTGVYIVGDANIKASVSADYVARYDGTTWYPMGTGIDDFVQTITKRGSDLYISGQFLNAGSGPVNSIAHYDGTSWKPMGTGISSNAEEIIADDSSLFVVGSFYYAGGKEIEYASRYMVLPYITAQTTSQAVCTGLPVPLSVTAYGTATLLYQWYFNGSAIPGATNNSYTIGSAGVSNEGNYYCIVKNDGGSITSSTIIISLQPVLNVGTIAIANTDVCTGSSVQMSVTATGSGSINYQWQLNASNISGATNSTYTIASVSSAHQGAYQCIITDACTTLTAGPTVLYVHALPNITAVASNSIICPGNSSTLTASGGSSYIWTPATGLSSTTTNPTIASPPASITYTVSGTDS
ncbi:MAG: immunoglobulin domain-containing protein, partial [Bacteroidota bacterium]